jgi:hypothetical protein
MAGIMDMFRAKTPEAPSSSNQGEDPNKQGKENLSDNAPTTDKSGKMPGTEMTAENPLDAYKKMFDNATNNSEIQAPEFKLDPKVLNDVSRKMDFTRGIEQETLTKATSGDVNALMDIIRTVGQNSYKAAIEHSTNLTDTYINQRGDYESKKLERGVKSQLTSNELASAPNYSHPVVKAELNRIANQFAAANPDASPVEVAKAAQKYISDLQFALNPSSPTKNSDGSDKAEEMDWTKYLSNS